MVTNKSTGRILATPDERVTVLAPRRLCLYLSEDYSETLKFFNTIDKLVFVERKYIEIDLTQTEEITAAASVMLFAKVTRCQGWAAPEIFAYPDQIIEFKLPINKETKSLVVKSGLWAAIKPGGIKKLERLWKDKSNPFKTGNNPAEKIRDVIGLLRHQIPKPPKKIIAALQESYLNIAHHAYDAFTKNEEVLHEFIEGRWWQYAFHKKESGSFTVIIYDVGSGIPSTLSPLIGKRADDCEYIAEAMRKGVTRFNISGRGMGFEDIKSPIDQNITADYLVVYSGRGQVIYRNGKIEDKILHDIDISGTLIEWVFKGIYK